MGPRSSAKQWAELRWLLGQFEHCVEMCERFDARRPSDMTLTDERHMDERVRTMRRRIDKEVGRLTAERLTYELHVKMENDARVMSWENGRDAKRGGGSPLNEPGK